MNSYGSRSYATLCITNETVTTEYISSLLQLTADRIRKPGDVLALNRTISSYSWFFGTKGKIHSEFLCDHLNYLLQILEGKKTQLHELASTGCHFCLLCFVDCEFFNVCVKLPDELIRRISSFGFDLNIDVYLPIVGFNFKDRDKIKEKMRKVNRRYGIIQHF